MLLALAGCGTSGEGEVSRLPFQPDATAPTSGAGSSANATERSSLAGGAGEDASASADETTDAARAERLAEARRRSLARLSPAEREVVDSHAQAMLSYRQARSAPVQPDFALVALTHTEATAAELRANLLAQQADRIAYEYPHGTDFVASYERAEITDTTAHLFGCTHYRAQEFDSANGSSIGPGLRSFDEISGFVARLERDEDGRWLLDAYQHLPLNDFAKENCE